MRSVVSVCLSVHLPVISRYCIEQTGRIELVFGTVNVWQSFRQQRDCIVHFLRLLAMSVGQARNVHETTTLLLGTLPNIHRF